MLNCFRLKKGRATFFRPETNVASFLHSMVLLPKVLLTIFENASLWCFIVTSSDMISLFWYFPCERMESGLGACEPWAHLTFVAVRYLTTNSGFDHPYKTLYYPPAGLFVFMFSSMIMKHHKLAFSRMNE